MKTDFVLLLGAGGHARACIDVIEQEGKFSVGGLVGLPEEVGQRVLGYPVLGADEDLTRLLQDFSWALITAGQIRSPDLRIRLFEGLKDLGVRLPVIVSPRAYVSRHAEVGEGTIVLHGAVVNAGAVVGRNCIINSQALIEHDVIVGDHCHIATGVKINSGVAVGPESFVGSNTTIRQSITIGARCVIGMGQRVLSNCENGSWVTGQ